MAFRFKECSECYFHGREPAMCDQCVDADEFVPEEQDDDQEENDFSEAA